MQRQNPDVDSKRGHSRNVVLIGFMGTGKTAIGRALARHLRGRHVDTDHEIEALCGKNIPQIFSDEGEAAFRTAEHKVVQRLMYSAARRRGGGRASPLIVSTGGGTALRVENSDMLRRVGDIVWLTASTETIVKRVTRNLEQRPLLAGHKDDPVSRIETLIAERSAKYAALATFTIDTSRFASPDDAAKHIISTLKLNEDT